MGIKLCFISPFPPSKEGLSEYSQSLIYSLKRISKEQLKIFVISFIENNKGELVSSIAEDDLSVYRVLKTGSANILSTVKMIPGFVKLILLLSKLRPDIIHLQFGFTRYFGGTLGEPFILLILLAKKISKFKLVTTLHTVWSKDYLIQRLEEVIKLHYLSIILGRLFLLYYNLVESLLIKISDVIVLPTKTFNLPIYSCLRGKYPSSNIIEIPHGVYSYTPIHTYIRKRDIKSNHILVLSFGSIRRGRGHEKLIDLIYKVKTEFKKDIKLVIAGYLPPTEDLYYLKRLIYLRDNYRLKDHIVFIPRYLPRDEVLRLHDIADLVIMDYSRMLGPSGALMWALATDTVPLIVANNDWKPGIPGIIVHDRKELPYILIELIESQSLYREIQKDITLYRKKYNFNNIGKLHLIIYKSLLTT